MKRVLELRFKKLENFYLADNQKNMPQADEPLYFTIDEKSNAVNLTERGTDLITGEGEDPNFFILTDIGEVVAEFEKDETLNDDDKLKRKDEAIKDYSVKAQRFTR